MLEEKLERSVEQSAAALTAMADDFFDHPEVGLQEFHAFETLTGWLEKEGFTVERGIAGMDTAFRAVWKHGEGGPNIGLLCEYDALAGLGHACGHRSQGTERCSHRRTVYHHGLRHACRREHQRQGRDAGKRLYL